MQWDTISQILPIIADEDMVVKTGGTTYTNKYTKNLSWDSKSYRLKSAQLTFSASQPYLSGAAVRLFWNGKEVATLHWNAFDSTPKYDVKDISGVINGGDNEIKVTYETAYGVVGDQVAKVSAAVNLSFEGSNTGEDPVSTSKTKDANFWDKLGQTVKDQLALIVVLIVVGFGVIWGLKSVFAGGFGPNPMKTLFNSLLKGG